jgi:tRNA(fMet)-specific endonuclease VapC
MKSARALIAEAMLDTNICIRVIRDKPTGSRLRFKSATGKLAISSIVLHELYVGTLRSYAPTRHREELEAFLPGVTVLDFDEEAAFHSATIKADLLERGNVIGPNDLLIAGHARSLGLQLITGNLGEFRRVDGLRCEDWLAEEAR